LLEFVGCLEAEFKGHPAKNEPQQHEDNGDVKCRHEDRVCQGKCRKKATATKYQPCFVSIPERRDGIHHAVPALIRRGQGEQDPNPQVESIQQNIEENGRPDQCVPNERKINKTL
jgi:hypothetical protein